MKQKIHPKYRKAKVTCACGNTFETGSTVEKLEVEVCSACHPFYTGKQKYVDTAGRVDRFKEMQEKAKKMQAARKPKKKAKAPKPPKPKIIAKPKKTKKDVKSQKKVTAEAQKKKKTQKKISKKKAPNKSKKG